MLNTLFSILNMLTKLKRTKGLQILDYVHVYIIYNKIRIKIIEKCNVKSKLVILKLIMLNLHIGRILSNKYYKTKRKVAQLKLLEERKLGKTQDHTPAFERDA